MSTIIDAPQRAAAIDPTASFCISAPAGSGKTELLIQRYLCLLARVTRPEQVLAITFTRKAAAEMRTRVLEALQAARNQSPCRSNHEQVTRALAEEALAADAHHGWELIRDISRLNIKTIDSFCASLTRQMPVLSQMGGPADTRDDAAELYAEAVAELFKQVDRQHAIAADLAALMLHFDNNWERLQELLVAMLGRRDQWRSYVGVRSAPEESEAHLVRAVESLVSEALADLYAQLAPYASELLELQQYAARNLGGHVLTNFPGVTTEDLVAWRNIRKLLLTDTGSWRKAVTKTQGFPTGKGEAEQRKTLFKFTLQALQQIDNLESKLDALGYLPQIEAGTASWQLVIHLSRLLPMLAAQLLLVFQKYQVVDHNQIAQSALTALGDDDAPTDLALRLDYRLEHILIDEFQDTSVNQYELVEKLTRGWEEYNTANPQAPRTLLIVGDGMQSIYGFRGANVGLFLRAKSEGFNGVKLQYLQLRCNFRSDEPIVRWINETFVNAFPLQDDPNRAAVSYSSATAVKPATLADAVAMEAFVGDSGTDQEVAFICQHIQEILALGRKSTIGVLARGRPNLQPLIAGLKTARIGYAAVDLDSLASSPVVADLMTLCRALANDADRVAWLALLRAPWCGLDLADLLALVECAEDARFDSIWAILRAGQWRKALSEDGAQRLKHVMGPLNQARNKRDRLALRVWVEQLWVALGGPGCAIDESGLQDAETFLQLLEQAEKEGAGLDTEWLSRKVDKLYMGGGDPASQVQLMTLHKAKGLEFDYVIIPQLAKTTRSDSREILLWDEHSNQVGQRTFLLAADDRSDVDAPTLYNYLFRQLKEKRLLEATRLLYVGATRAVQHLLLTASLSWDDKLEAPRGPPRQSLLAAIWPNFETQMHVHIAPISKQPDQPGAATGSLVRLCRESTIATAGEGSAEVSPGNVPSGRVDNHFERSVGTVVHLALYELSLLGILPDDISAQEQGRWRLALHREGLYGADLDKAWAAVCHSVTMTLQDETGRWVMSEHVDAHSEWPLTGVDTAGKIQDLVIDRSFIDSATGCRWIVDYKNSRPEVEEQPDVFFAREAANYRVQLQRYRDVLQHRGNEPLRCALYFTALGRLHTLDELNLPPTA